MNLAVLLPMLDEGSFGARFLSSMDVFLLWWVAVLAIGLGVAYRKKTRPIAVTLFGIYCGIAIVAAAVMSMKRG
jgi:hypothetical protein